MNLLSRNTLALAAAALMTSGLAAQDRDVIEPQGTPSVELSMERRAKETTFHVRGSGSLAGDNNFGVVILSYDSATWRRLPGMPDMLQIYTILGAGAADPIFTISMANERIPPGMPLYAQGLLGSADGLYSSQVVDVLAIDP